MWDVVAMGIGSIVITPFGMQFLQQPKQLPPRLEESHLTLFLIASPILPTFFSPTGTVVIQLPWTSQSSAHSNVLPSKGLLRLLDMHCRLGSHGREICTMLLVLRSAGISFIPLLFESLGGLSSLTSQTISAIGLHLAQRIGASSAITRRHLYQKCSISLWRGNAALWLHWINTIPPGLDGIT